MRLIKSVLVAQAILLTACSSTPVLTGQAEESNDRKQTEHSVASEKNSLQAIVIHDRLFIPGPVRPQIFVNGKSIGTINQGEKITFYVAPGLLRLGWSALTEGNYREQEFTVAKDTHNVFHLRSPAGDVMRFIRGNDQ